MADEDAKVFATIRTFLGRVNKKGRTFEADTALHGEGLGLDSLETAELSALLEDTHGTDPFQSEEMPQTVGDIFAFYEAAG